MSLFSSLAPLAERWRRNRSAEAAAEAASQLAVHAGHVLPFGQARSRFAVEITRARRYRNPVTLAAVQSGAERIYRRLQLAGNGDPPPGADEEVPREVRQLVIALMSPLVRGSMRVTDLVAYDATEDDHLILFTETAREEANRPLERLRERVEERFGVELRCGVAEFPGDGYTLDDLVETARRHRAETGGPLRATGSDSGGQ